jgi:hypothetical protein
MQLKDYLTRQRVPLPSHRNTLLLSSHRNTPQRNSLILPSPSRSILHSLPPLSPISECRPHSFDLEGKRSAVLGRYVSASGRGILKVRSSARLAVNL